MTIHVISTINGQENEGMRNIATHYSREWEKECTVRYSGLKEITNIIKNTVRSDVTVIFARGGKKIYYLLRFLEWFGKNVWLVCVQKPDPSYKALCDKKAPVNHYFSLIPHDISDLAVRNGCQKVQIRVGINKEKFVPVSVKETIRLKQKYGFSPDKKLVVHVGHCSAGRGLEQFAALSTDDMETLVVISGMFEDASTKRLLEEAGVRILSGYLPNVEEIYQMADVYFFPTKSPEHVIGIPLSVMEALACGTPAAAYGNSPGIKHIHAAENAMYILSEEASPSEALRQLCEKKSTETLLLEELSWNTCAKEALSAIKESLK